MITRITGILVAVDGLDATLAVGDVAYQILIPAYESARLSALAGERVTFHTIQYLESQGQGSSYIPRLIGFASPQDRRFFELMTTLDGFGNRRALRALAQEPAQIARAILSGDAPWLTKLPEIGKKTAEKVILELKGKVDSFLSIDEIKGLDAAAGGRAPAGPAIPGLPRLDAAEPALAALMALGETRGDAERMIRTALEREPALNSAATTPEQLIAAAYGTTPARA
jgi:holliday junction DNA helicase RuvA